MPSLAELRRTTRSVRSAEHGPAVRRALRPRGLEGRGPLTLQLLVADREARLLWHSPDRVLMVCPPRSARTRRDVVTACLHVVNVLWPLVSWFTAPLAIGLTAVALALVRAPDVLVLLLVVVTMLWATGVMVLMAIREGADLVRMVSPRPVHRRRRMDDGLRVDHWSIALCHADPDTVGALLRDATALVDHLGDRYETVPDRLLLCRPDAVTTTAALEAVRRSATVRRVSGREVLVVHDVGRPVPRPAADPGPNGILVLLAAACSLLPMIAGMVAAAEREACATACTGGPVGYGDAVFWLLRHFVVLGIPGVAPSTGQSKALGLAMALLGLVIAARVVRVVRTRQREDDEEREGFVDDVARPYSTALVLVANDIERAAVLTAVATGEVTRLRSEHHTALDLGVVGRTRVVLGWTEQGIDTQGAATLTTDALIRWLAPDYVLIVGVGYGLREHAQEPGDLVVSSRVRSMNWRKEAPGRTIVRGELAVAPQRLLDRCRDAARDWSGPRPDFGLTLSLGVLVDSAEFRAGLLDLEPDAVCGDMELAGVQAACSKHKVDWIGIKGISDYGMGKTDGHQPLAARNAAEFLAHLVRTGNLDPL